MAPQQLQLLMIFLTNTLAYLGECVSSAIKDKMYHAKLLGKQYMNKVEM